MKSEVERTKEALGVAVDALKSVSQGTCPSWLRAECYVALESVRSILDPPPEFEEVTVESWANFTITTGEIYNSGLTESEAKEHAAKDVRLCAVKLTGPLQRPKPRMVERSASAEFTADGDGDLVSVDGLYWVNHRAFTPWLAFTDGQKATVVVTWTEPEAPCTK